jgi:protein-disulfide isomerase
MRRWADSIERRTAMTTVVGLFDGFSEAQRVTQTLVAQGIRGEAITIISHREETSVGDALAAAALGVSVDGGPASRGEPAALVALGVPADVVEPYAMVLDGGGTLVSVAATEPQVAAVVELMERYASADLATPGVP